MSHSSLDIDPASDDGLAELEARVRQDLTYLCYPPANWDPPTHHGPEKTSVHDVVVVGGGMCGLVASFALLGAGIGNLRFSIAARRVEKDHGSPTPAWRRCARRSSC